VHVWDITGSLKKLEAIGPNDPVLAERLGIKDQPKPLYSFSGHQGEGFAMDWSHTVKGMLATGDCTKNIHIWTPKENGNGWIVDQRPLSGHSASIEDLQWSPNEKNVLASCSVDCRLAFVGIKK
jgi:ribosome assembly protein RRB1